MPALRLNKAAYVYDPTAKSISRGTGGRVSEKMGRSDVQVTLQTSLMASSDVAEAAQVVMYPITVEERKAFRTKYGKSLTPHQWDVYDFVHGIPRGKVTTYKDVSAAIGGSPRSVGNALRNNPFAPYIPCHRVIASNHFIGGFFGEWGRAHKTGTRCDQKLQLLKSEGVEFNVGGYLKDLDLIWIQSPD